MTNTKPKPNFRTRSRTPSGITFLFLILSFVLTPVLTQAQFPDQFTEGFRLGPSMSLQYNYFGVGYEKVRRGHSNAPVNSMTHSLSAGFVLSDAVVSYQDYSMGKYPSLSYSYDEVNFNLVKRNHQFFKGYGFRLTASQMGFDSRAREPSPGSTKNKFDPNNTYYVYRGMDRMVFAEGYFRSGYRFYIGRGQHHYFEFSQNVGLRLGGIYMWTERRDEFGWHDELLDQQPSQEHFFIYTTPLLINFNFAYGFN